MGTVDQGGGLLPTIKCSDCGACVSIAGIGEHECSALEDAPPPPPPKSDDEELPTTSTMRFFRDNPTSRTGRTAPPPPRIDPSAANRPFLQPDPPVAGIKAPHTSSSISHSSGPNSPFPKPQRSQTTPLLSNTNSSEMSNPDGAFQPFPRARSRTLAADDDFQNSSVPSHERSLPAGSANNEFQSVPDAPSVSDNVERKRRHRREASMDSKSIYRLSANSLSHISPSISRGRNVMDEAPPLPTGPIKSFTPSPYHTPPENYRFETKEDFDNDRNVSPRPLNEIQNDEGMGGFNFGLPTNPKPTNGVVQDSHGHQRQFSRPQANRYSKEAYQQTSEEQNNDVPSYRVDEEFSVSSFARGLGLGDPYHAPNESISSTRSGSSPSEAPSGSSFSSRPSVGTTLSGSKPAGSTEPSYNQNGSVDLDLKPPQNQYEHDLDSPTDPFFQQSGSSRPTRGCKDLKIDTQQIPVPPEPKSAENTRTSSRASSRTQSRGPRPRCRGCGEPITGKSVSSADGRLTGRYHKACFVCHVCNSPFQTADFYILNNNPYCAQHYHQLNGTLCSVCNVGIEGPCRQTEEPDVDGNEGARNQRFHPDCFKCRTCRIVLDGDYFDWEGQVYCERDGRRAALASQAHMMPPPPPSPYGRRPPPYGGPGPGPRGGGPPPPRGRGGPRRPPGPPHMHPHGPPPRGPPSGSGSRLGVPGSGPGPGQGPRFPERRTTKLLMI